jgi:hypothetical protein
MRPPETGHVPQSARCGAKTRSGAPCKSVPVTGRRRCRMHGGADGSGAPEGSKNGNYKHGRYTKEVAATRQWLREATQLLRGFKLGPPKVETMRAQYRPGKLIWHEKTSPKS